MGVSLFMLLIGLVVDNACMSETIFFAIIF